MKVVRRETRLWILASVVASIYILVIGWYAFLKFKKSNIENVVPTLQDVQVQNTNELIVDVTAYCPCSKCNSKKWKGRTIRNGWMYKFKEQGIKICAVDPIVIPLDSKIIYDGVEYEAKDVGGLIKGNKIDILLDTHKDTLKFGVKKDQKIIIKE